MTGRLTDTLQVNDLALQIEGPSEWIGWLRGMWPGWMGGAPAEPWVLSLAMVPSAPAAASLFEVRPRFADGVRHLTAPGFAGWIDPGQATAYLEAHPGAGAGDLALFVRTCLAMLRFRKGPTLWEVVDAEFG